MMKPLALISRLRGLLSPGSRRRPVLVHAHLFKNAGTTFDWSLQRCFGESFFDHRDDEAMKRGAVYFGPWLDSQPRCQAISSHWVTPPLPQPATVDISLCLLLRDPIDRMRSVYQFERQQQGVDTPGSIRAKQLSFVDYMRWQMEPMPGPVVKNYQTRYCSGDYLGNDLDAMFDRACQLLNNTGSFGLVHRYDESMVLFEYLLKPLFPQLDLSYRKQNVLATERIPLSQRRAAILDELGELQNAVLAANYYDLQLFALAERRFDQLLATVPDLPARLAALQRRNQALAEPGTVS